jgi:hypothetical protein
MIAAHTPAPWATNGADGLSVAAVDILTGGKLLIATAHGLELGGGFIPSVDEGKANARLIAAAPELLEALKEIDKRMGFCLNRSISADEAYDSFYQGIVKAAIAKATGEQV